VRYLMLICGDEREYDTMTEEQAGARMAAWGQYTGALHESGKLRGGERLRPAASATTVRLKGGDRLLSDGPFAETKEQLGGYFVIEADNLDEALDWASKMPHLPGGGSVEVRPIWDM
jgi:hypothetical protein